MQLPLCTKSLMVNVFPQWVPSGLSLDAPRGAGLMLRLAWPWVSWTHTETKTSGCHGGGMWMWGGRVPVDHKNWMMFQNRIFEIKMIYRIFACASSRPHLPCSAFLLSLIYHFLSSLWRPGGAASSRSQCRENWGEPPTQVPATATSALPQAAFPSPYPLLTPPSPLLSPLFFISPFFFSCPPSLLCPFFSLYSPVLWENRMEGEI